RPRAKDDGRRQKERDVAAEELRQRDQESDGKQHRSDEIDDGGDQERRPCANEGLPRQGPERPDGLQEGGRVEVRVVLADARGGVWSLEGGGPVRPRIMARPERRPVVWLRQRRDRHPQSNGTDGTEDHEDPAAGRWNRA